MKSFNVVSQAVSVACAAIGVCGGANAVEIDAGIPELKLRWDNTVRYNVGVRTQRPDAKVLNNVNFDDSDSKFGRGDIVTNRVDLLSEFDASYQKRWGGRISGAAWYDQAYHSDEVKTNPAFTVPALGDLSTAYAGNRYTDYTKRWNRGPSGEVLDAFVFGRFDLGEHSVDVRAGRHNIYWGESLFSFVHGVSYSQGPVDLRKAVVNPGVEAKELFLPLNQISAQAQVSDTLTLAAQYFLEWKPSRLLDGGTYLGDTDFITLGGGTYVVNSAAATAASLQAGLPPGTIGPVPFRGIVNRPKNRGDWGIKAAWRPLWLDGTLGLYYREFTDKLPQIVLGGFQPGLPVPSDLRLSYVKGGKLFGVSLGKDFGGVSVGSELVYHRNTALRMGAATVEGFEPRGNTWHGLVNIVKLLPHNDLWSSAALAAELTWNRWDRVTANADNFKAEGFAGCPTKDKWDGCTTRNFLGLALKFEPTWYQVGAGVDLSLPITYMVGLKGNSALLVGGDQGAGSYSVGLTSQVRSKYAVSLQYNGYLLRQKEGLNALGMPAVTSVNGPGGNISDRGWLSLTFKTSF